MMVQLHQFDSKEIARNFFRQIIESLYFNKYELATLLAFLEDVGNGFADSNPLKKWLLAVAFVVKVLIHISL